MLEKDPKLRISASDALNQPYFFSHSSKVDPIQNQNNNNNNNNMDIEDDKFSRQKQPLK